MEGSSWALSKRADRCRYRQVTASLLLCKQTSTHTRTHLPPSQPHNNGHSNSATSPKHLATAPSHPASSPTPQLQAATLSDSWQPSTTRMIFTLFPPFPAPHHTCPTLLLQLTSPTPPATQKPTSYPATATPTTPPPSSSTASSSPHPHSHQQPSPIPPPPPPPASNPNPDPQPSSTPQEPTSSKPPSASTTAQKSKP